MWWCGVVWVRCGTVWCGMVLYVDKINVTRGNIQLTAAVGAIITLISMTLIVKLKCV